MSAWRGVLFLVAGSVPGVALASLSLYLWQDYWWGWALVVVGIVGEVGGMLLGLDLAYRIGREDRLAASLAPTERDLLEQIAATLAEIRDDANRRNGERWRGTERVRGAR